MLTLLPFLLSAAPVGDAVLVKAGTIHLVAGDQVLRDGAILIEDGKIVRVGSDLEAPAGVREVDYGPDAVIVPGLVAADSSYGQGPAAERAAAPMLRASDNFDPYSRYTTALRGGVTTAYLAPADDRLIAGQGGVAKMAGDEPADLLVSDHASIHGSIATKARSTPGYWEPPLPATVDVGLGIEQKQLPRTTMGAIVGLQELLAFANGDEDQASEWGALTGPALKGLIDAGTPWRMGVDDERQARALLDLFREAGLPLVLEAGAGVVELADELAAAGVSVIFEPGSEKFVATPSFDFGTFRGRFSVPTPSAGADGDGKRLGDAGDGTTASRLAKAGVRVAVATPDNMGIADLLQVAAFARRGGLTADQALRAITLTPAEILGVADRVGSLEAGKDADFAVLNGAAAEPGTSVRATWIEGELRWENDSTATKVIRARELHVGDGTVLSPGEILISGSKIVEVGRRVGRPAGAVVISTESVMPGAIDAWGQLGLEGSRKGFSTRLDLPSIIEPADGDDLAVAASGVTTVNLTSKGVGHGTPSMAYKPAGATTSSRVLSSPTGVLLVWDNPIPSLVGQQVQGSLAQAADYANKWREYEQALAKWRPEPEEAEAKEEASSEEAAEEGEEEKKKKPKDKPEPIDATGTWQSEGVRLRLLDEGGALEGTLRADGFEDLIDVSGTRDGHGIELRGTHGQDDLLLTLTEEFEENDVDAPRLDGTWAVVGDEARKGDLSLPRTSSDYPVVRRSDRRKPEDEKDPKGKPRSPGINPDLEPLRQALMGKAPVFVQVTDGDQLAACVGTFNRYGIKPVLIGNPGVNGSYANRIAGVLATSVSANLPRGVEVMFRSNAEQAAAELLDQVAMAVADGLSPERAIQALTGSAARMLHIDDRVGTLAEGKDADLILFDGPPLHPASQVTRVFVDGKEIED